MQYLLSLPPRMAAAFERLEAKPRPRWFATCDPEGVRLGSGGGTAHLLGEAWGVTGAGKSFNDWLRESRKLIFHAGGESRRLPAYAPTGKLLMPMPVLRWSRGQRLDQTLLDLQLPDYERVLAQAPRKSVVMITSGDALVGFPRELPVFPEADVVGLGLRVAPEAAAHFGVLFAPRGRANDLAFCLQKPSAARIRSLADEYLALVDTGIWLLSERAVRVLMQHCGWDDRAQSFRGNRAGSYEFYAGFSLGLGSSPSAADPAINQLTAAVVALADSQFLHFGTSAQMIESTAALQGLVVDETKIGLVGARSRPDQVTQNSRFDAALRREGNHNLWVENSVIPAGWQLASEHILTGVPENDWTLRLEPGVCIDFVPVDGAAYCLRVYGYRDSFRGKLGDAETMWLGAPARAWFAARKLVPAECGLEWEADLQTSALFPVLGARDLDPRFLGWLFAKEPVVSETFARKWRESSRLSAREIGDRADLDRLYQQRKLLREACLVPMLRNSRWSVFFRLDLEATAKMFAGTEAEVPQLEFAAQDEPMQGVHYRMFRSAVLRHRQYGRWLDAESEAFAQLRSLLIGEAQVAPAFPRRDVKDDQIVWARSPVRLDLAGGWTDTPPYCIEHGGRVLNVAVDLNGQPPIQVFAKLSERPELVLRSIDLGVEERVRTFEELDNFGRPDSPFALPRAALALAGFLPRFHITGEFKSLEQQLRAFGGGIELALLSAVPKGSGLGTSSILAATVLAAVADLCGLAWDRNVLFTRTLALEQMLTTGGGWQDQAGAIFRGVKLIQTSAGLSQKPTLNWLPDHLFNHDYANRTILLYYTGLTRLARNILVEIVRGIFLNSPQHLRTIADIGANSELAAAAIQRCEMDLLHEAVRRSWELNQRLDPGTKPPQVEQIVARIQDYSAAMKLLGAGGGGYLLVFARDETAAARIRQELTSNPPNARARFVDFSLSEKGLQLTRS